MSLPDDTHIGRVHLRVADLGRSLELYQRILGFRVVRSEDRLAVLAPGGEAEADAPLVPRELLVLEEIPGIAPRPRRPQTTGLYHVALLVPGRPALGRALLALRDAAYPMRGMSDHAVSESLYLDDPDGNGLEIYADRPRSAWPVAGGMIQMTVDPMDVAGVLAAAAEHPRRWTGLPAETVVGHVHFTVARLDRAVAFYRDVVGFDLTMQMPTLVAVSAGGYHHHLNLNTWAGEGAPADSERMARLSSWELRVPDPSARAAVAARVAAAGGHDPDGVALRLV
jgi:catechol 2,3-dioxygenase